MAKEVKIGDSFKKGNVELRVISINAKNVLMTRSNCKYFEQLPVDHIKQCSLYIKV